MLSQSTRATEFPVTTPAEITTALAQTQPGDTIVMRDGVWPDADILFSGNGTSTKPITLRAATLGRVQLTGLSRLRIAGNFLVVDGLVFTNGYRTSGDVIAFQDTSSSVASNCKLINCAVVDYNPPDSTADTKWVSLYGLSNRVEYCYFRGKTNEGTTLVVWVDAATNGPLQGANYHLIAHNYFGLRPALGVNGGETIRIGTSDVSFNLSRTTVEQNFFEHCNGDVEIISSKSCENIYRRNTFFECEGALTLRHGNASTVEGNYFFGSHKTNTGGVRIIGDDHKVYNNYFVDLAGTSSRAPLAIMQGLINSPLNGYFQVHRAVVAFNTFVNCNNSLVIGLSGTLTGTTNVTTLPPVDCTIANNIVTQTTGKIVDQRITPSNLVWEANILFGASLGISTNNGTLRIDPKLVLTADGLWRPTNTSPALGIAQGTYGFATNDIDGDARSASKDVGCDQVSPATPVYPPLTSTNVGPLFMRFRGTFLTWAQPADIQYGTALSSAQLNATANASGTFAYEPPTNTVLNVGIGHVLKVVFTPDDLLNFNVATQTVTINVVKAVPVITWTNPSPIHYGIPLGSAQLNATANAAGTLVYDPPMGTVLTTSNGQILTVRFMPNDTNTYEPVTRTVFINVTKGAPVIAWTNPAPIEQGTALSATQLNATSDAPGSFMYDPPLGTVLAGGVRTLSVSFTPADNANFNGATGSVTINVTVGGKTVPSILWPAPAPLLAGAPLSELQLNALASVPGTFLYAPPTGTILPAGNGQVLSVIFTPDDTVTYTKVTNTVLIDVGTISSNAIVRVAYLIPSNRSPQANAVTTLQKLLPLYQNWFADQMERSGFGRKTFTVETEPDGTTPFIHIVHVPQTDSFLRGDAYGNRVLDAARQAGLPVGAPAQLWWLIPETHAEFPDGAISGSFEFGTRSNTVPVDSGWALSGSDHLALYQFVYHTNALPYEGFLLPEIGPYPLVEDVSFPWFEGTSLSAISSAAVGGGLRSLTEAFGLDPDYRNDENFNGNVMGFGFRGIRGAFYPKTYPYNYCTLSYASALALAVNPFFNWNRPVTDTNAPTVSVLTSGERTPVNGLLQITFQATDNRALHAALLTWERDSELTVVEEMTLSGTSATRTFAIPFFSAEQTNRYAVTVFDQQGNRRVAQTTIYPKASINRSPQPFITVRPLIAGVGQDIIMDASGTFDPEHSDNLLEVMWDLNGDGIFDTEPTTDLVFTNNYSALGTYVIRALVTDPAGASAISAPVAVSITVCPTTLSPVTRFHGFAGSTGVIDVTVGPKCQWSVLNTNDWVEILSGASGAGPGQVSYNVLPNPFFAEREGSLLIGDESFLVKQHAIECTFSLSPTSRFHGYGTGANSFKVTTKAGCAWFVENTNSWITILSGASGVSTGTVSYAISENRVTGRRIGNLRVGEEIFTVNQWGTNCELVLSPINRSHSENSETGSVSVTTASGCSWQVVNTNSWITVTTTDHGTNTSSFGYQIASNPSLMPRSATFFVNDQPFTISQGACSYSISPSSRTHSFLAQTGTVSVSAGNVCQWLASTPAGGASNDWLTLISGTSGPGSGTLKYALSQNPSGAPRTATFNVAGDQFTVMQSGKPCSFAIEPEEFAFGEAGGVGEILVTTDSDCPWMVINPAPWITIISGASGDRSGRITYLAAPNDGGARSVTLTVGGQEFSVLQASAVRAIAANNLVAGVGQTNCFAVTLQPHGGEHSFGLSLCFDTNLLVFRSATLQTNTPSAPSGGALSGATLTLNTNLSGEGRVGFDIALAPGATMTSGVPVVVNVCMSAAPINGKATTTMTMCDSPTTRHLTDAFGRELPASFGDGSVNVIGFCSLAESLDVDLNWKTSTPGAWTCQTNVTHDGVDAAVSGAIPDNADSYIETTLIGPGVLSFWWRVSSELENDRLRLYMDGTEQFRITGEVDWEWRTLNIASGSHLVRWRYSKNLSLSGGADRGWVDEVVYVPSPPAITGQPADQLVNESSTVVFTVAASGQGPISYQWLFNGVALSDGTGGPLQSVHGARTATLTLSNVVPAQAGLYSVIVGNAGGSIASAPGVLSVTPLVTLGDAVDAANLIWTTSGSQSWLAQTAVSHDGFDAARSGAIGNSQSTALETTMAGPATVSFWWKVSSEPANDRLAFLVNGSEQARISGEVDWEQRTFNVGAGAQTLRWTYSKNSSTSAGQDRAWVDQVVITPVPVIITAQPLDQAVDPGATAIFTVGVSGTPPLSYQWQCAPSGGSPTNLIESATVRGVTSAILTLSNAQAATAGKYSVLVSNAVGSAASSSAALQVNQLVALADAIDSPMLVWTTNGTPPWVGQTAVTHDGVDAARSGHIGDGQTTSFQTTVAGPGTVSFWWKVSSESGNDRLRFYINGSEQQNISGEVDWTWRSFAVSSGSQVLEWRYAKNSSVSVSQDRGWVDEIVFVPANIPTPPVIAIQPTNITSVAPGGTSFSAIAIGSTPLSYQWLFNGTPLTNGNGLSGATTTNLLLATTSAAQAGGYSVLVTNSAGAVTSGVAVLAVITFPIIVSQPVNQSVLAGSPANFFVSALGTAPLAYQWKLNGTNIANGGTVSGATSTNLRLASVTASNVGNYSVVISNGAGNVTSIVATVTISTPPTIVFQPTNRTVALNSTATFAVSATGSAPLSYQWKFNGANLSDGANVSGANGPTLLLNHVQSLNAGTYSVVVSNAVGGPTSTNATLTVLLPPVITTQPIAQTIGEGSNVTFTVAASGLAPLTYRWRLNGTNLSDGPNLNGTTTATLSLSNTSPSQSGNYSVEVSNAGGSTLSANAPLFVIPMITLGQAVNAPYLDWTTSLTAPWIVQTNIMHDGEAAAQSGSVSNGSSWIETTVVGPGAIRFWWRVSSQTNHDALAFTVDGSTWTNISGEVNWQKQSFPLPPGPLTLRWSYNKDATLSSGLDRAWLDEVDFAPTAAPAVPVIVSQPASQDSDPGNTVAFTVDARGTAPLSYEWRFEGQNLSDGPTVLGANSPTLRLFNVQASQSGLYDVVVRNAYSLAISERAFLNVAAVLPLNVALDTDHTNLVWRTGGYSPWHGEDTVTADSIDAAQSGPLASSTTNWLQTTITGPGALSFWWKVSSETNHDFLRLSIDGIPVASISGEVEWQRRIFPISTLTSTARWEFAKDANGSAGQDRAWVDLVQLGPSSPEITNATPDFATVEQGTTIKLKVDSAGTPPFDYQWRRDGTNVIEGPRTVGAQTERELVLVNAQPEQSGTYVCEVRNAAGVVVGPPLQITVTPSLPIAPAVNTPTWIWETGGYSWWVGTTSGSHDGVQCARNGYVPNNQSAWMRTTVVGPGTLKFYWRASTQLSSDFLKFSINSVVQTQISGSVSWQQKTFSLLDGPSVLQWEYVKDALGTNGSDQVFVDEVNFTPAPPVITNQPLSQVVDAGATALFSAGVKSAVTASYRWRSNGVALSDGGNISGATTSVLRITGALPSQSATYSLVVSNIGGSTTSSNALLSVIRILPLGEALDDTNHIWATGTPPWVGQPTVTHDGVDAARSPAIGDSQTASAQATITGPGTLTFWWKVSSETNKDFLIFYLGNVEQARISGEVEWHQRAFDVPDGNQTVKWTYSKNGSGVAGQDRGWVDQFVFTPLVPSITSQPVSQSVEEGTRVTFSALAAGTPPLTYQWRFTPSGGPPVDLVDSNGLSGAKTTALVISNAQSQRIGSYSLLVSNAQGVAISSNASLMVTPLVPLPVALESTNVWTTNGSPPWVGQMIVSHDGTDAARSGAIGDNGSNSMATTVSGPGTLSFWWKVSSETNSDKLIFSVNNVEQARISGEVDWEFKTFTLGSGSQSLRWSYSKNSNAVAGQDRAWVDEFFYGPQPPTILAQPTNQFVDAGSSANFRVSVVGAPPLTYQWQRNGVNLANGNGISGATSSNLVLSSVQTNQAGTYRVIINGSAGTATSAGGALAVFTPLPLDVALDTTGLVWTTDYTPWIGHGLVTHDGVDAARSGTISDNGDSRMLTTVTGPCTLTFWWKVSSEPDNDRLRFYVDGTEEARISGEVDWTLHAVDLGSGSHELRWRYSKNSDITMGQDRGWVDQVQFGIVPPSVTTHPVSTIVDPGGTAMFSVSASGTAPFTYRWLFNGSPLFDVFGISGSTKSTLTIANAQQAQVGQYSVTVSNSAGFTTSSNAALSLLPSLEEALDTVGLAFTQGGSGSPWRGRQTVTHDGIDAAESGATSSSSYTWFKTTANGPAKLSFWWKVSSELDHDWLRFMVDGSDEFRISGEVDWQQVNYDVPSGSHELQWRYSKNSSGAAGQDRGWVDQIVFGTNTVATNFPPPAQAPSILIQPTSQTVDEGETVDLTVAANGSSPLSYQWFFTPTSGAVTNQVTDSGDVGGSTTAELTLFSATPAQAGNYFVIVSNTAGVATSIVVRLTVNHILTLAEAVDMPELFFFTDGDALWEGHPVVTRDGIDAARSGRISDGQSSSMQTMVDGPGTLNFWWKISSETNSDVLVVSLNGAVQAFISGEVDWEQRSLPLGPGPQFLEWSYFKNASLAAGDDRAWVDELMLIPASGLAASRRPAVRGGATPRISMANDRVQITWEARTARSYEVLYKDDLSDPEWKPVDGEISAAWTIVEGVVKPESYRATVEDFIAPGMRFYRVLEY